MEYLIVLLMFLAKTIIVVAVIFTPIILLVLALKSKKNIDDKDPQVKIALVNIKELIVKRKKYLQKELAKNIPDKKLENKQKIVDKVKEKKLKPKDKARQKLESQKQDREAYLSAIKTKQESGYFCPENIYIVDFNGSTKASEVKQLRAQIDAILDVATDKDEVIVNLTSPGGMVNTYGLCASQLIRIRQRNINLVCTVDSVAASGGYLMACVANKIIAAPFAYIGSIGVIAALPNFNRLLDKHDIDYEQITAGKYKRTLTFFGKNTDEGREKFKEELEAIHNRFKEQVLTYRPHLDMEKIATGEHWLASDAKDLGLVDEIMTSDEYIEKRAFETINCVMKVVYNKTKNKSLLAKIKNLIKLKKIRNDLEQNIIEKLDTQDFMHIK